MRVDRTAAAAATVARVDARASATGDTVRLPVDQGPADRGPARSLLAHELVHVAQQRRRPDPSPDDTPEGRRLERAATTVERLVEKRPPALPLASSGGPASHTPAPTEPPAVAAPAGPLPARVPAPTGGPTRSVAGSVQRAPRIDSRMSADGTDTVASAPAAPTNPAALADELFPHLRRMLLDELLDHRERAGGNLS